MIIQQEKNIAIVKCGDQETTLTEWCGLIDELDRLDCAAVVDARHAGGNLTEIDAYLLALHAGEKRHFRRHRTAVVISKNPERYLNFFAISARSHGLAVDTFDDFDNAAAWVAGDRNSPTRAPN